MVPVHEDERGHFLEVFRRDKLRSATGFDFDTAQVNSSLSRKGVLRGFHYKENPPGQAKLVSVMSGAIYDVALDMRPDSPTFGRWHGVEQRAASGQALLIQSGLAHAFLALEPNTVIVYLNDSPYQPEIEHAIHPLTVGVDWQSVANRYGIEELVVNDRDLNAPTWQEIREGIAPTR